ncbi:hypothetical protein D9J47_24650 [Escherichia coli]|nr:hypothetical protein [Escherichia coli]EFC6966814.1 hypothetical protein [Escherichia coli]EFN5876434.1 hypothetical protein [Escherichia coli]EFO1241884.1 hypothetical protein [Escherichia coli]MHT50178.1 hypothetical protein [Escherichia coli]
MNITTFRKCTTLRKSSYRCFPPLRGASQVREMTQHIVSLAAEFSTTCCADGRWRCAEGEEDPELIFFGSRRKKRETCRCLSYPYAWHLHMTGIYITHSSAYPAHIHMYHIRIY